jgi:hypothetical protein
VELLPANSNTSPEGAQAWGDAGSVAEVGPDADARAAGAAEPDWHGSDNVIVMPVAHPGAERPGGAGDNGAPRGNGDTIVADPAGPRERAGTPRHVGYADILAHAIAMPGPQDDELAGEERETALGAVQQDVPADKAVVPPPLPEAAVTGAAVASSNADHVVEGVVDSGDGRADVGARMNVRITQRTADFEIPLSAMSQGQPITFLKSGAKITFAEPQIEALDAAQPSADDRLRLEFDDYAKADVIDAVIDEGGASCHDRADMDHQPAAPRMADTVVRLEDLDEDEDVEGGEFPSWGVRGDLPSEDDLVEISRRFAPVRQAE